MYEEIARIAERGCIDMLFFGDGTGVPSTWRGSIAPAVEWGVGWPRHDMSPYIAALAQITTGLGFGVTYSSTYMHPFFTARLLNSLDHVTGGRIAFNVVASARRADAANYGFDELMDHDERYDLMEEFVDVCDALWASVEPDAFVWDRATGQVADPGKVAAIAHRGHHFSVQGPLACVPSPQVRPVIIQAGGSPRGMRASAHFADHVFAVGHTLSGQAEHRRKLDAALTAEGRDPSTVGILWDILLVVAETEREAKDHKEQLAEMLPFEAVGTFLSHNSGYDFSTLPATFSLAELNEEITASGASPVGFVHALLAERGGAGEITRDEFFERGWRAATGYDHTIAGSAEQVADHLEEVFEATGNRGGFMVAHPQATPGDLLRVVDLLVPELQRRGRFRTRYEDGATLRETLAA
jgi:FMN-dependent oxidoreductase (nitrilotriacetate monooxygenase family)